MPKDKNRPSATEIEGTARGHPHRHSLPLKSAAPENPAVLRHTRSQNYGGRKRVQKTTPPPPIPEGDGTDTEDGSVKINIDMREDQVKLSLGEKNEKRPRASKSSMKSGQHSRSGVDNAAFEADLGMRMVTRDSAVNTSTRSSMRDPSVQTTVVREQYCCCMKWSRCERNLFITVSVLALIIIVLVIVVVFLAIDKDSDSSTFSFLNF